VTDTLPAGLTPTAADQARSTVGQCPLMAKSSWPRATDILANGAAYPNLTLTVKVANNAPASVANTATVAAAAKSIWPTIAPRTRLYCSGGRFDVSRSQCVFRQGDAANSYRLTVNNTGSGPTVGAVDTDRYVSGRTDADGRQRHDQWLDSVDERQTVTATRSDVLPSGASYPALHIVRQR